ncbi:MAG: hypothetical protein AABN34_02330 [Acidobacteriota bacterium]
MAHTPDLGTCLATDDGRSELLPLSPFNALHYHFGQLLGVDDFETAQAYHRAKGWMHNAWLHGEGVVWGFGVKLDQTRGEIRVMPGLALDAAGHELHLEGEACVNLGEWFDKHKQDPGFTFTTAGADTTFDAHVVVRFKACLTRQVPALMEPCDNAGTGTAYSRVFETLEIQLLPNLAPARVYPYHLLRLMFGLDQPKTKENSTDNTPEDQAVLDEVNNIQALPAAQQAAAWLKAFHRFAALDEIGLRPATSEDGARTLLFPGRDDDPVVLADITAIKLTRQTNNQWVLGGGTVDTSVRQSHVATATIQDLLGGSIGVGSEPGAEDIGPRVEPGSVLMLTSKAIMFRVDRELHDASVKPAAFSVTWFDPGSGWQKANVLTASYGGGETKTVNLELKSPVRGRVRLIVDGTGPSPLLGANLAPFAGAAGGPPGTRHNGHDFVYMKDLAQDFSEIPIEKEEGNQTA